jgi:hypothetical protein
VAEHELTVTHKGCEYQVILDGSAIYVDDSFDHEFGTEVRGHWELDWEETEIVSVIDTDGEEIDPYEVVGLTRAIRDASNDIEIEG